MRGALCTTRPCRCSPQPRERTGVARAIVTGRTLYAPRSRAREITARGRIFGRVLAGVWPRSQSFGRAPKSCESCRRTAWPLQLWPSCGRAPNSCGQVVAAPPNAAAAPPKAVAALWPRAQKFWPTLWPQQASRLCCTRAAQRPPTNRTRLERIFHHQCCHSGRHPTSKTASERGGVCLRAPARAQARARARIRDHKKRRDKKRSTRHHACIIINHQPTILYVDVCCTTSTVVTSIASTTPTSSGRYGTCALPTALSPSL